MKAYQIKNHNRKWLESKGFAFVWAESAYRCCVRYNGEWIGTWDTVRAYGIPQTDIIETLGLE